MSNTTTRLGLVQPVTTDSPAAIRTGITTTTGILDNTALYTEGTLAGRPAASTFEHGHIYRATDTGDISIVNGTSRDALERQSNKAVASGYCDLDSGVHVPLSRLSGITLSQLAAGVGRLTPVSQSTSTTAVDGRIYICTSNLTITLPTAAAGLAVGVFSFPPTVVTIAGGGPIIYGLGLTNASSITLGAAFAYVMLECDGTNWYVISGANDTGWVNLALPANWIQRGLWTPAVRRVGEWVYMRGSINQSQSVAQSYSGTVPDSRFYSSSGFVSFPVSVIGSSTTAGGMTVDVSGNLTFVNTVSQNSYLGLDGVRYQIGIS